VSVVATPGMTLPVKSPPGSCVSLRSCVYRPKRRWFEVKLWSMRTVSCRVRRRLIGEKVTVLVPVFGSG
jgi:hypothetical protein